MILINVRCSGLVFVHGEGYFAAGDHIFFSRNNNFPRLILRYSHGVACCSRCLIEVLLFLIRWWYQSRGFLSLHSSHMNGITIVSRSRVINLKKNIILIDTGEFYEFNIICIQDLSSRLKITHQTLCYPSHR